MIGREVISMMSCFLDARIEALPRASLGDTNDSQDDFGVFDVMDFEDSALNALLGVQPENGTVDTNTERDKELAHVRLAPKNDCAVD